MNDEDKENANLKRIFTGTRLGEILKDESMNLSEEMSKIDRNYIINKRSKRFHLKCCASVRFIDKDRMREFRGKREDLINGNNIEFKCRPCEICDSSAK